MAQIVQHNIMALNSYNKLSTNNSALSKNLEKLSSGYKINRAGDDAAGLAISEKMRAQITGLERATSNAQDGISLVQTAEGALTEVHSMLNRIVDLATQSANGTYEDGVERENLQAEVDALLEEIDRISAETNFNGINLLDGSVGSAATVTTTEATDGSGDGTKAKIEIDLSATTLKISKTKQLTVAGVALTDSNSSSSAALSSTDLDKIEDNLKTATFTISGQTFKGTIDKTAKKLTLTATAEGLTNLTAADCTVTVASGTPTVTVTNGTDPTNAGDPASVDIDFTGKVGSDTIGSTITFNGTVYEFVETGESATKAGATVIEIDADAEDTEILDAFKNAISVDETDPDNMKYNDGTNDFAVEVNVAKITVTSPDADTDIIEVKATGKGLGLQIGDTASQRMSVQLKDMSTTALGVNGLKIDTEAAATKAIQTVKDAINLVSKNRAELGAVQNRLEHTITNLETTTENLTNAESSIRDTDMAKEMMEYTKNNVLSQAAQAMLAQANQQPQQVLQLLQ